MFDQLAKAKVLICVGSGGVGKTTVAAALAALFASQGRRVLVLTIDPAQRLKTTLGLPDSGEEVRIQGPGLKTETLYGAVINAKATFDDFVSRAVTGAGLGKDVAERILRNKLYLQLSTTLSGSQEFTSLERLYSAVNSGLYDLVVLDTPPTQHAIDFLQAPQKLAALFNDKISQWFRQTESKTGWLRSVVHAGTVQVLGALERLTGSEFMRELRDFFQSLEGWQGRLEDRVTAVHRLLVDPDTHFVLVTSFDAAKLQEADFFAREIRKGGYQLSRVLINRAFPLWRERLTREEDRRLVETPISALSPQLQLARQMLLQDDLRSQQYQEFVQMMARQCPVERLPELGEDVSDIEGVLHLQSYLMRQGDSK